MIRHFTYLLAVATLAGCSGDPDTPAAGSGTATHQFATPQSVIDAARDALTRAPPDNEAFFELVYAETPWQEQMLRFQRALHDSDQDLEFALYERFGAWTTIPDPFGAWPCDEITFLESADARATARCVDLPRTEPFDRPGFEATMHLVRIADRWWISGYSYEYVEVYSRFTEEMLTEIVATGEKLREKRRAPASRFAQRIRDGEFASLEEALEMWDVVRAGE